MDELRRASLEQLLALLEAARGELEAGWVQGGWWLVPGDGGRRRLLTGFAAGASTPEPASAVCLVGALVRAGSGQSRDAGSQDSQVGRAIGAVYDALWESRGQPAAEPGPGLLAVSSPQVRLAQVQTLTRWNDATGRTGNEVLGILDRAIAQTILSLATVPTPRASVVSHHGEIMKPAAGQPGDDRRRSGVVGGPADGAVPPLSRRLGEWGSWRSRTVA